MKNIVKLFSMAAIAAAMMTSCQEELVKSDIDGQNYSTSELAISGFKCGEVKTSSVAFEFTIDGYDDAVIESGIMYAKKADFSDAKSFICAPDSGTNVVKATVKGLSLGADYYFKAYAYKRGCNAMSEALAATTLFVPITMEWLDGAEFAKAGHLDAWDETYDMDMYLAAGEGDTIYVCNYCPYFAENGFVASRGYNYMYGILKIDEGAVTATITCPASQPMGYQTATYEGFMADGDTQASEFVFKLSECGTVISTDNWIGVYLGGWYSLYPGLTMERLD